MKRKLEDDPLPLLLYENHTGNQPIFFKLAEPPVCYQLADAAKDNNVGDKVDSDFARCLFAGLEVLCYRPGVYSA